ncbi:MAG: hypothetical protein KAH01_01080 [Caldisericia bacterium]|nr:hypothetical protein [Caldisericia bacterium]
MNIKKILSLVLVGTMLFGIQFVPGIGNSKIIAASPDKIGIYTNSFGYYIYVSDPIKNRVLKYSTDGTYLAVAIPTVATHTSGEKWVLKKCVDIITCRLTDVIGVADAVTGHSFIYELNGHTHHKNGQAGVGPGKLTEMWDVAMTEIDEIKSQALLDRKQSKVSHWTPPPGGIKDPRDGTFVRDFGNTGTAVQKLKRPEGMSYAKNHDLLVADTGNKRIAIYNLKGKYTGEIKGKFSDPCDIGVDFLSSQGNKIYVLDRGSKKVHVFAPDHKFIKSISLPGVKKASALTIDTANSIWVTDIAQNSVFKFDQNGKQLLVIKNAINPPNITRQIVRVFIKKYIMTVNDEVKRVDAPPFIQNGRTLVPLRAISEGLGAEVGWDGNESKVTVKLGSNTVEIWIGNTTGKINGKPYPIPDGVAPLIKRGRTFVPIRFVAEALNCWVGWNPKDLRYSASAVTIYYPK